MRKSPGLLRRALPALALLVSACGRVGTPSPPPVTSADGAPIRIVALVVVDQLPSGLVERYRDLWVSGFRRLVQEGHYLSQTAYPYDFTETAPGHATLATGVPPSRHGIVSNDFWVQDESGAWREVYALEDRDAPILGVPNSVGRGPRNLMRNGLGAWMRDAHPLSRAVSISKKDRSAIALMGDVPDAHVYWLQARTGRFVTSRHYRATYPDWVERFNEETMHAVRADTVWESSVPASAARLSRPDTFAAEGDRVHTAFPHRAWLEADTTVAARNTWVSEKPVLDSAVLELALSAIDELALGKRGVPDFLALSFSQTDYVGHDYGPGSREQLDNLLRLDKVLGRLFDALDAAAGPSGWVLALSADHGVLEVPEWVENGEPVGRRIGEQEGDALEAAVEAASARVRAGARPEDALREVLALPSVAAVYPMSRLEAGERPDSFAVLYANGHFPGRFPDDFSRGGLRVRLRPRTIMSDNAATHGSPYWYDRHVPLFFLGAGVRPGVSSAPVSTLDLAPTLARLARIPSPADLPGRVLELGNPRP